MPVPASIGDLSTTAASNSPAGSESPITSDDYFRAHASFIAGLRDGKGLSTEVTIASAATVDIGGAASPFVYVTGTTTITSFGTTYNGPRFLRFAGALTLTHNATTLILPGAANITTAAGDTCLVVPVSGGWRVAHYTIAANAPGVATTATTATTATALATGRTISLTGDVTATTGAFDGTSAVTAAATIAAGAITTAKVADGNLTAAKLNGNQTGSAPIFGVRAWAVMNLATSTLLASGNIASVTAISTGAFTLNFTTAMPSANYAVAGNSDNSISNVNSVFVDTAVSKTTTAVGIGVANSGGTRISPNFVAVFILG